jgi:hypothetical protein
MANADPKTTVADGRVAVIWNRSRFDLVVFA